MINALKNGPKWFCALVPKVLSLENPPDSFLKTLLGIRRQVAQGKFEEAYGLYMQFRHQLILFEIDPLHTGEDGSTQFDSMIKDENYPPDIRQLILNKIER